MSNDYIIKHHGILGQKWGVRRFQNSDGTLTPAGQKRYNKKVNKEISKLSNELGEGQAYKMAEKYKKEDEDWEYIDKYEKLDNKYTKLFYSNLRKHISEDDDWGDSYNKLADDYRSIVKPLIEKYAKEKVSGNTKVSEDILMKVVAITNAWEYVMEE